MFRNHATALLASNRNSWNKPLCNCYIHHRYTSHHEGLPQRVVTEKTFGGVAAQCDRFDITHMTYFRIVTAASCDISTRASGVAPTAARERFGTGPLCTILCGYLDPSNGRRVVPFAGARGCLGLGVDVSTS